MFFFNKKGLRRTPLTMIPYGTLLRLGISICFLGRKVLTKSEQCSNLNEKGSNDPVASYQSKCYRFVKDRKTWDGAVESCRKHGGQLLRIMSEEENEFIYQTFYNEMQDNCAWIGVKQSGTFIREYKYPDGQEAQYTNMRSWYAFTARAWLFKCMAFCNVDNRIEDTKKWHRDRCEVDWPHICQAENPHNETAFTTSAIVEKPAMTTVHIIFPTSTETNSLSIAGHSYNQPVIIKTEDGNFVTSKPLWSKKAYAVTMCARQCSMSPVLCDFVNYNRVTKECRGFGANENAEREKNVDWEVWTMNR